MNKEGLSDFGENSGKYDREMKQRKLSFSWLNKSSVLALKHSDFIHILNLAGLFILRYRKISRRTTQSNPNTLVFSDINLNALKSALHTELSFFQKIRRSLAGHELAT